MTSEHPSRSRLTRRGFLIAGAGAVALGGAGVLGVETDVLPGRRTLHRVLGLNGPAGVVPKIATGPLVTGSFVSKERLGRNVGWSISYPPGSGPGDHLPVLVVLHGIGGTHATAFGAKAHGLDHFLAKAVSDGAAPMAIASIDGGRSYWHKRESGEDAGAMVIDEFLPLLKARGLLVDRIGLMGWSMGGYGVAHVGGILGSAAVAVIVAESPALWATAAETAPGAFDGPADFAANTVVGRQSQLDGIPVRIDCGTGDGFYREAVRYVSGFATKPAGGFEPGGHNDAYWRRMAPAQLAFVAKHLDAVTR